VRSTDQSRFDTREVRLRSVSLPTGDRARGKKRPYRAQTRHTTDRCHALHHRSWWNSLATGALRIFFRLGDSITPVAELDRPGPFLLPDVRASAESLSPPRKIGAFARGRSGFRGSRVSTSTTAPISGTARGFPPACRVSLEQLAAPVERRVPAQQDPIEDPCVALEGPGGERSWDEIAARNSRRCSSMNSSV
jgi:hypothetical protein